MQVQVLVLWPSRAKDLTLTSRASSFGIKNLNCSGLARWVRSSGHNQVTPLLQRPQLGKVRAYMPAALAAKDHGLQAMSLPAMHVLHMHRMPSLFMAHQCRWSTCIACKCWAACSAHAL